MFGCVMETQFSQYPSRLLRRKVLVKSGSTMRIEIVQNQMNASGFWISFIHQPAHLLSKVDFSALFGHCQMPPRSQRLKKEKEIDRTIALILIVIAQHLP